VSIVAALGGRGRRATVLIAVLLATLTLVGAACDSEPEVEPLKIAYLGDFSGDLAEFGPQIQQGVDLAVEHLNAAGGVGGQPVQLVIANTGSETEAAILEARRLVEEDGVHAFVGPLGTEPTIAVVSEVSRSLGIPTITPSATSPVLSDLDDDGLLFRTAISDAAQGPILAQLVAADLEVYDVAVLYEDSAYGRGLADAFDASYIGNARRLAYQPGQTSYRDELATVAAGGASYLVAIGYPAEAIVYVSEALDAGLFDEFVFVDGTRSRELFEAVGPDRLSGARGTAASTGPATDATRAFDEAFLERFGALPVTPFVREAYDATIALALAAESAGSVDGTAITAALPAIANPGGEAVIPGVASLRFGLERLRDGGEVDYRGAASAMDFDEQGDLASGYVGIWSYEGGDVVELEAIPFELN
jgi:ABC-type branched-subunit amino acid transport system substrate-binding protein